MQQEIDSRGKTCCKAEEHIKHVVAGCTTLRHLDTVIDTIRWLFTSTGRYVNLWVYRLLRIPTNMCLRGA
jgi:hypothetical protein